MIYIMVVLTYSIYGMGFSVGQHEKSSIFNLEDNVFSKKRQFPLIILI